MVLSNGSRVTITVDERPIASCATKFMLNEKHLDFKIFSVLFDLIRLKCSTPGRLMIGRFRGMATIRDKLGHCLHEIFTLPTRISSPSPYKRELNGSRNGERQTP
jgi:hypothetical protein